MDLVESGQLPLRTGIRRLVDEAVSSQIRLAVCSTSNERAVTAIVQTLLGPERRERFAIFAGDIVARKKPDPAIYNARERMGSNPLTVWSWDSRNGLLAAGGGAVLPSALYAGETLPNRCGLFRTGRSAGP
jgi:beta-phosphoglucomutase-like phosphatase (HAD superfamily)